MTGRGLGVALVALLAVGRDVIGRAQDQPRPAEPPAHYVIGPDDVLSVVFWHDKDMSCEVVVRPDGKISLPLVNDIQAGGRTPDELREALSTEARRYLEDTAVTIIVKEIKSRKAFITGMVERPGPYPLNAPTTVMQLISLAGGLKEFADGKRILIMRAEAGQQTAHVFNYRQVLAGKNLAQNIELRPGDTVVVP